MPTVRRKKGLPDSDESRDPDNPDVPGELATLFKILSYMDDEFVANFF